MKAWLDRRQFHPDAPRLPDLGIDPEVFVAGSLSVQSVGTDGPWADAERLWDRFLTGGARAPGFRLVRLGSTLPRQEYCRSAPIGNEQVADLADPNRVLQHYALGATVVLQAVQFSDPAFAELSTNLALELDHPIQVNAYLTPPAERGLDVHFDFHDVIVVQLAGRKRWRVWPAIPRSERAVKRGPAIRQPSAEELGPVIIDRVLQPGDCLAVPRGFPHAAESEQAESVHLTIGIMAVTWNRVLRDLIDNVAAGTALADRLPFGGLGVADTSRPIRSHDALMTLADHLTDDRVRRAVAIEVWGRQPQTRLRLRQPVKVGLDQTVDVTPGPLLWLDRGPAADGKHGLHLGDRWLRFPTECTPFVAGILEAEEPFSGATLGCSLDDSSRLAVLSRLATEGVIRG